MKEEAEKRSFSGAALAFGVIGIVSAIVFILLFGWIAGMIVFMMGAAAIILGVISRSRTKSSKGNGGIITGIITLVLSFVISGGLIYASGYISSLAGSMGFSLVARHAEALNYGIVGMMIEINDDGDDTERILDELDILKKKYDEERGYLK